MREMVGGCCVCSDDRGWSENPLVYCDGQSCTVAVHQACYGIVTVPTGPWFCRKCEERTVKVRCTLCPSKYGALKRTDSKDGWAHVVCALYIPEVRFGNVTTMEPIQLGLIPHERYRKPCYICNDKGKSVNATFGACMQCNRAGCKQQFHVTCAQSLGLLCEEAGNYLDNVKYCGYCQHHYSKLKKGGNVKTIPPYKPVSTENQLSDSEEAEAGPSQAPKASPTSPSSSKRKSSSSKSTTSKSSTSSTTKSSTSSSSPSSQQKTVHSSSSSKSSDKLKVASSSSSNNKSAKIDDTTANLETDGKKEVKSDTVETTDNAGKLENKDNKVSKKRKTNSRTPTPVSVVPVASDSSSGLVNTSSSAPASTLGATSSTVSTNDKKGSLVSETADKPKKQKIETTQSILTNQPVVALTSISTIKASSPVTTVADTAASSDTAFSALPTQSIIQTAQTQSVNSLVVSVPLTSTSLSPHHAPLLNNQTSVLTSNIITLPERSASVGSSEKHTPIVSMLSGQSNPGGMLSSEMSGGGLKITFEKQDALHTEVDMELEVSPTAEREPIKRARSQSNEKTERLSRSKKRTSGANGVNSQLNNSNSSSKRSSRSHHSSPPSHHHHHHQPPGAFASISQAIKDSPPSSPESESQGPLPSSSKGRSKGRKNMTSLITSSSSKDSKDIKLFQNGITAPHMLGNQLNPNSNMAQKMSDHLNSELEAHSIFNPNENSSNLMGPQLPHRVIQSHRASSAGGSSTASGGSGLSSMMSGGGGTIPQTLDQLLERQWEQGSQFLMEQAQHFDIASLLSCLHQLRAENLRLEEDVSSLLQRRDHLLAVNARLAIPLTGQPAAPQSSHPHTVNNIHPSVGASHSDMPRSSRHSTPSYPQGSSQHSASGPVENGLPPSEPSYSQHRSPAGSSQPSPNLRLSEETQIYTIQTHQNPAENM